MVSLMSGEAGQQVGAPETFTANIEATGAQGGAVTATIQIDIRRFTPEAERSAVEAALTSGGYPAFLTALRKAPEVGSVSFGDRRWAIRWARERVTAENSRSIVLVTDEPMFFVGGGRPDAKRREGFKVALLELNVDHKGTGRGVMTAAARVKPGGESGVLVDDYAEKPIRLVTVVRKSQ